jgi:uncharacterized protein YutE (UPF0331/DUF86 family)
MDKRIKEHLKYLNRYALHLMDARKLSHEEFLGDEIRQASVERFLQLAIESCLNIGNRLLSLRQFEKPVKPPESYVDIFRQLHQLGVTDSEFTDRLVRMAKFRNRLVHMYWEIDREDLYRILQEDVNDFREFQKSVVDYLNAIETT